MARVKHTYKSKKERQNDIILTAHALYGDKRKAFTNAAMAKRLGMVASTRLKRYMDDLVTEGWLEKEEKIHRKWMLDNGGLAVITKHEYRLTEYALEQLRII